MKGQYDSATIHFFTLRTIALFSYIVYRSISYKYICVYILVMNMYIFHINKYIEILFMYSMYVFRIFIYIYIYIYVLAIKN